jgi:hypothetical protein
MQEPGYVVSMSLGKKVKLEDLIFGEKYFPTVIF